MKVPVSHNEQVTGPMSPEQGERDPERKDRVMTMEPTVESSPTYNDVRSDVERGPLL